MVNKSIDLGVTKEGKSVLFTPYARKHHMHVIGASGKGKSKFIEHMIRKDIANKNGLCLIDPHGYLYNDLVKWCTSKKVLNLYDPRKIVLLDVGEKNWTFGFNPLPGSRNDIEYYVELMVQAVAKVWGAENTQDTPLLDNSLNMIFTALIEKGLSLVEAAYLIDETNKENRNYIINGLGNKLRDKYIQAQWDYQNNLSAKAFRDEFGSSSRRLSAFLKAPSIETMIGQTDPNKTINFHKLMDEGYILLVNLGTSGNKDRFKIADKHTKLLGTLLVNEFLMRAKEREERARPFNLYIDECSYFVNKDIERIGTECRKFGLHMVLAHQTLAQLKEAGEAVYQAVMACAQTKVVFGGLSKQEAVEMADEIYSTYSDSPHERAEIDLQESVKALEKETVVGHKIINLESHTQSISEGDSDSIGRSEGAGRSIGGGSSDSIGNTDSHSFGVSHMRELHSGNIRRTHQSGDSYGSSSAHTNSSNWSESSFSSSSRSHAHSTQEGESWTVAEAIIPILEKRASQVYSRDTQIHKLSDFLRAQKSQFAIIKLHEQRTQVVKTPFVKDVYAKEERINDFVERVYKLTDYATPRGEIVKQIEDRHQELERQALLFANPEEPKNFVNKKTDKWKKKEKVTVKREPKESSDEIIDVVNDSDSKPEKTKDLKSTMDDLWGDV